MDHSPGRCGMSQSTPLRGPTSWSAHHTQGQTLIPIVTSRPGADHFPGLLHHRNTILSTLGLPFPHGFVFGNSRATSQWVTHHGIALAPFSLNFGVPTEPEASELPKGLLLGKDENIHLKITTLGDVGCHNYTITNEHTLTSSFLRLIKMLFHNKFDPNFFVALLQCNSCLHKLQGMLQPIL